MFQRLMFGSVIAVFALGCGPKELAPSASSDIQIDGADPDSDTVDAEEPRMCVSDNGNIYVVWVDVRTGTPQVLMNRSTNGGSEWLTQPVQVNQFSESNVWSPDIACGGSDVWVVWEDDRDGEVESRQVYYQHSTDNGDTWTATGDAEDMGDLLLELDEDGRSDSKAPRIVNSGDKVYAAWFDNLNGAFDIFVASSFDRGASFGAPVRADSDEPAGSSYSAYPQLAAAGDNVYVAWQDTRNGGSDIYFARSNDGGRNFAPDVRLDSGDSPGTNDSFSPRLAADGNTVYVVWHDARNGEQRDVYTNFSLDGGASWLDGALLVEQDNPGLNNSLFPVVAVQGSEAHIAWQDKRSGGYDVFYRKMSNGTFAGDETRLDLQDPEGASNSVDVGIAVEGGSVVVHWTDFRDDTEAAGFADLYYNFSEDAGNSWNGEEYRIDSTDPAVSWKENVSVAIQNGQLFASWIDGRNGSGDVFFHYMGVGEEASFIVPTE